MIRGFCSLSRAYDVATAVAFGATAVGVVLSITAGVVAVRAANAAWRWLR